MPQMGLSRSGGGGPSDIARFYDALCRWDLLPARSLEEMTTLVSDRDGHGCRNIAMAQTELRPGDHG